MKYPQPGFQYHGVETKVLGIRTSSSRPNLGIVHVQSTARKNIGEAGEAIVLTWQRKVQVYKDDEKAEAHTAKPGPAGASTFTCSVAATAVMRLSLRARQ